MCCMAGTSLFAQDAKELVSRIAQLNRTIETSRPSRSTVHVLNNQVQQALVARQAMVEQLILTRPSDLQSVALPADIVNAFTPEQKALTESTGQWTGTLEQMVADDFESGHSKTLWKLNTGVARLEVAFPEGSHPEQYRGKRIEVAGVGTTNVVAAAGFALAPSVKTAASRAVVQAEAPVTSCSTYGSDNVAILLMNQGSGGATYPAGIDSNYLLSQYFNASPKSASTFLDETSFSLKSVTGQVFGPFNLGSNYSCSQYDALAYAAIDAAKAGGVDFSNYSRVSVVFPESSCSFGGLGDIGCRSADSHIGHPYSVTWIPIMTYYNGSTKIWGTVSHELGHNLGLNHSSTLDFGTIPLGAIDYTIGGSPSNGVAVQTEYGDSYSDMGDTSCGGQFSSHDKLKALDWLLPAHVSEASTAGNFTIVPYENSTGVRAVRVLRDALTSSWIWLEYRQSLGAYDSGFSTCFSGTNVYQGALGHYESPGSSDGHMFLLDFNPSSYPNNFRDAALTPGNSWTDPFSPLRLSVTSANSNGLALSVAYDAPCTALTVSAPSFSSSATSGSITVTAPGNCSWQASKTASWITLTGTTSGSGNGTVPFSLTANASTEQRTGFITVSRNNVAVSQKGSATFVSPMNPVLGSGSSGNVSITLNDPLGANDFQYGRIYFSNSHTCEVDVTQSGNNFFFFIYDPSTGNFTPSILAGSGQSGSNGRCTLFGSGTTVVKNGNQIQMSLSMTFASSMMGAHRVTMSVCDSTVPGCTSELPIGTWQVTPPPSLTGVTPYGGMQGAVFGIQITGSGTHFTNSSVVSVAGSGVSVSGVSAASNTQLSANVTIDPAAAVGARTLTVTTGSEVVTGLLEVFSSTIILNRPRRFSGTGGSVSPGGVSTFAVSLPTSPASSVPITCAAPKPLGCAVKRTETPGVINLTVDASGASPGEYQLRLKTANESGQLKRYRVAVIVKNQNDNQEDQPADTADSE